MVKKELKLTNGVGMHARPAGEFTKIILGESATVTIEYNDKTANVKSLLNVLALGLKSDEPFTVTVEGENEAAILDKITEFIEKLDY